MPHDSGDSNTIYVNSSGLPNIGQSTHSFPVTPIHSLPSHSYPLSPQISDILVADVKRELSFIETDIETNNKQIIDGALFSDDDIEHSAVGELNDTQKSTMPRRSARIKNKKLADSKTTKRQRRQQHSENAVTELTERVASLSVKPQQTDNNINIKKPRKLEQNSDERRPESVQ